MDIGQLRVGKGYLMVTVGQQGKLDRASHYSKDNWFFIIIYINSFYFSFYFTVLFTLSL